MLPKGLTISVNDNMIIWKNTSGDISKDEAVVVSTKIKDLIDSDEYKTLIVDNSHLSGVWSPDVDKIWIDLMSYLPTHVDKTVTICENVINKLQVNYLSKQAGTENLVKAFVYSDVLAIKDFLNFDLKLD